MNYAINRSNLFPLIDEEVSRVASETYADDGTPLYDNIIITANDKDTITRLEDDAINALVKRTYDICTLLPETETDNAELVFYVPGFDTSMEDATSREITRYIVLNTCAAWFQSRCTGRVEEYTARGQVAQDKAVTLLKSIKAPSRI